MKSNHSSFASMLQKIADPMLNSLCKTNWSSWQWLHHSWIIKCQEWLHRYQSWKPLWQLTLFCNWHKQCRIAVPCQCEPRFPWKWQAPWEYKQVSILLVCYHNNNQTLITNFWVLLWIHPLVCYCIVYYLCSQTFLEGFWQ